MSIAAESMTQTSPEASASPNAARVRRTDLRARGEPALWSLGGALAVGVLMIIGFLALVFWNGIVTFIPKQIAVVTETGGAVTAGEPFRSETFRPAPEVLESLSAEWRARIEANDGYAHRTLYRIGNFDLYNEDFRWVPE
ncbi:MAG: phosphate ABC transporter, permease protein PstA, partial [Rhodospirillaceae bacterium]